MVAALLQRGSKDLGTVSLGAAAILLSRAFPSFVCSECDEVDVIMLTACGGFFVVGMLLRYLAQADDE